MQPSAATQQALDLTQQRALNGSPVTQAADQSVTNLLQGGQQAPGASTLQSLLSGYADPGNAMTQAGAGANPYLGALQGQMGQTNAATGLLQGQLGQQNAATGLASSLASNGPNMAGNRTLQASANGQMNNSADPLAAFYATQNPNANPSQTNLGSMASGAQINPYLDAMYGAASKPVIDSINAQFSAGGRTGSAANQDVLGRNLGDLSANIFGTGYQNAVQNQLAANGQVQGAFDNASSRNLQATGLLGQYSGQDISNRLNSAQNLNSGNLSAYGAQGNAASLLGNLSGQDMSRNTGIATTLGDISGQDLSRNASLANQVAGYGDTQQQRQLAAGSQLSANAAGQASTIGNAANSLDSQYNTGNNTMLQAAQQAPALANNDYTDLQNALNVGGAQDSQQAAQIQDLLTRWQYGQQQPWNLLNNYSGLLTGYAGLGGQTSGTGTQTLPKQSLLPSLIGAAGSIGAAAMSDRNAKRDIRRIGTYPNGLPMYSFQYKHDRRKHHVGLMAQDVIKVKPEAVVIRPDGFMAVHYDLALAA